MIDSLVPKRSVSRFGVLLLGFFWAATPVFSQSPAFSSLIEGLYDESFPIVKPAQITDLSNYQVLDTREKEEFEVSHLPGASWTGYGTFKLADVKNLDPDQPVLVYCTVGVRSEDIGKKLHAAGFTRVYNLYGGIIQWANSGKPLEAAGVPTDQVHTYSRAWGIWLERGQKVH